MTKVKKRSQERVTAQIDLSKSFHERCIDQINKGKRKISVGRFLSKLIRDNETALLIVDDTGRIAGYQQIQEKLNEAEKARDHYKKMMNTGQSRLVKLQDQKNAEIRELRRQIREDESNAIADLREDLENQERETRHYRSRVDAYTSAGFMDRLKYLFTGRI